MNDARSDLAVALAAATAGAQVVRAAYGTQVTRRPKSDLDFATDADLDAEAAILGVIDAARPEDGRLGEESGTTGGPGARRWLVDPLCGTLNFAARTPLVAVNVALLDAGASVACVCVDPIAEECFWSDGHGAYLRRDGFDEPLVPTAESRLVDINCDGPVEETVPRTTAAGRPAFRSAYGPRVTSTTLAVAWVAAGTTGGLRQ